MTLESSPDKGVKEGPALKEHVANLFASKQLSVSNRAMASRDFLKENKLKIGELADIMGIKHSDTVDDRAFLIDVVKIQHKLGFKTIGSGKLVDGIFDVETFRAYVKWFESPDGNLALSKYKARLVKEYRDSHDRSAKSDVAPVAEKNEALAVGVELNSPEDVVFIGDSNAARMGWRLKGARGLAFGGLSSGAVLDIVKGAKGRKQLSGAKLAIIRVGGNDGSRHPEKYTLANIKKIVAIAKRMGVQDVRIITRPPYSFKNKSMGLRKRSLSRRDRTFEIFGEQNSLSKNGNTNVGVIDAYNLLVDVDGNLKREFTSLRDPLHMNEDGYYELLTHIFHTVGAENAVKWVNKTRKMINKERRMAKARKSVDTI